MVQKEGLLYDFLCFAFSWIQESCQVVVSIGVISHLLGGAKKIAGQLEGLGAHTCFLFSVQLIAAAWAHSCRTVGGCIITAERTPARSRFTTEAVQLSFPGMFSKSSRLISRCARCSRKKAPLSLFPSRSLPSCVRSLSRSTSQFLTCRVSPTHNSNQEATLSSRDDVQSHEGASFSSSTLSK